MELDGEAILRFGPNQHHQDCTAREAVSLVRSVYLELYITDVCVTVLEWWRVKL